MKIKNQNTAKRMNRKAGKKCDCWYGVFADSISRLVFHCTNYRYCEVKFKYCPKCRRKL